MYEWLTRKTGRDFSRIKVKAPLLKEIQRIVLRDGLKQIYAVRFLVPQFLFDDLHSAHNFTD